MSIWNEFIRKHPYVEVKLPYSFSGKDLIKSLEKSAKNVGLPYSENFDYEISPKVSSKFESVVLEFGNIKTSKIFPEDDHAKIRFYYGIGEGDQYDLRVLIREFIKHFRYDDQEEE